MAKVSFHTADRGIPLTGRTAVKDFIESIFRKEKKPLGSVRYVFCSDSFLLRINNDFLQHDYYTDIITFGLSDPSQPIEAEIYISTDRVRDNAASLDESFKRELLRVVFHGTLHLCGYRDKKKSEITIMRQKEEYYLRLFEKNN